MKKVLLIVALVLVAFVYTHRTRLYVRDPLASVTHAGTVEAGVQVYINQHNDVLLEQDNAPRYLMLLKADQPVGTPRRVTCLHWLACLTEAEQVPLIQRDATAVILSHSDKAVSFRDTNGLPAEVRLR